MGILKRKTPKDKATEWAEFEERMRQSEEVIRNNPGLFPVGPRNFISEFNEFCDWQKRQPKPNSDIP